MDQEKNFGEARERARTRRKYALYAVAMVIGGMIGGGMAVLETGEGDWFMGDIEGLSLPVWASIMLAAGFFFGFFALPIWGFTQIDQFHVQQNLQSFTAGMITVLAGYPIWATLAMGGLVPFPRAFDIFALGFVGTMLTYLFVKLRG